MSSWNPWRRKRQARLEAYLKTEGNDWMAEVVERRRERDTAEKAIDVALHQERREGSNWLENREIRVSALFIEHERDMIARRTALRRRIALECPDLLSDAELNKLQEQMLRGVQTLRQAKRDDYERRARVAGLEPRRSEQRDAADLWRTRSDGAAGNRAASAWAHAWQDCATKKRAVVAGNEDCHLDDCSRRGRGNRRGVNPAVRARDSGALWL